MNTGSQGTYTSKTMLIILNQHLAIGRVDVGVLNLDLRAYSLGYKAL